MSVYVYRRAGSDGARTLATAGGWRRWRDVRTPLSVRAVAGDWVIAWGEAFAKAGVNVLNGGPIMSKFTQAERLAAAGVATVQVRRDRPAPIQRPAGPDPAVPLWTSAVDLAEDFINEEVDSPIARTAPRLRGIDEFITALTTLRRELGNAIPAAVNVEVDGEWVGRANDHMGGSDLLRNNATDYFVRREQLVREYRVHSFLGRSIRAGIKAPREGFANPHAWIRSWDGGWRILYDGVSLEGRGQIRTLAHQACAALGLDFGAVDIGERADGTYIVLEVNQAPGLDGGTVDRYVTAINHWMDGSWTMRNAAEAEAPRRRRAA